MKSTNIKLLLCGCTIAALGALALEGCSSSDSSSGAGGGTSSGGTSSGGASSGGKGGTAAAGTSSGGTSSGGTSSGGASSGGTSSGGTSSGGTSSAGTGGASGGTGGSGAGAGGTGTAGSGGTGGGAHPTAQECTDFCTLDASTCTGLNAAYANVGTCQTDCLAYALGNDSDPTHMTATSGDNFACRAYHLQNAIKSTKPADVTTHCGHTAKVSSACM